MGTRAGAAGDERGRGALTLALGRLGAGGGAMVGVARSGREPGPVPGPGSVTHGLAGGRAPVSSLASPLDTHTRLQRITSVRLLFDTWYK